MKKKTQVNKEMLWQKAHEKMFHIISHYGNAHQNHNEVLPAFGMAKRLTRPRAEVLARMWNAQTPLIEM